MKKICLFVITAYFITMCLYGKDIIAGNSDDENLPKDMDGRVEEKVILPFDKSFIIECQITNYVDIFIPDNKVSLNKPKSKNIFQIAYSKKIGFRMLNGGATRLTGQEGKLNYSFRYADGRNGNWVALYKFAGKYYFCWYHPGIKAVYDYGEATITELKEK